VRVLITDLAPVAAITPAPIVLLVNPSVPAKTVPEFITYAKASPGKVKWPQRERSKSASALSGTRRLFNHLIGGGGR